MNWPNVLHNLPAFGLGTMVYNGLEFGAFFEVPPTSPCYQILQGVNPVLQMIFTFMQMYFIFMNSRVRTWIAMVQFEFDKVQVIFTIFFRSWTSIASKSSPASVWCTWWQPISAYGYALWYWKVSRRSLSITRNWVRFRREFSVSEIYLKNHLTQTIQNALLRQEHPLSPVCNNKI